ncbi:MAG: GNAT family N-acetyltransferase [Acidimicrobiia bacterium]|nr:GNAT family N-acetyltransferase [Acidimicrobiia bacterium]
MIVSRRFGIAVGELWFEQEPDGTAVDIIRHRGRLTPPDVGEWVPLPTLHADLTAPSDQLLSDVKKNVRYEIRRAEADGVGVHHVPAPSTAQTVEFADFYDAFAADKCQPLAPRALLERCRGSGMLTLSWVEHEGTTLGWHAHVRSGRWVRLLLSGSHFRLQGDPSLRAMIGRANRHLHWKDFAFFQANGVETYDWGGIYTGTEDPEQLRIADFKRGFGGHLAHTYECLYPVSTLGRLSFRARSTIRGLRGLSRA